MPLLDRQFSRQALPLAKNRRHGQPASSLAETQRRVMRTNVAVLLNGVDTS
ncbi:MAG TPA: hypothetical protein VHM22_19610 [Bradyrhizobium sp.]|nr:hypothetical protein [Bradyrhizobium sp.]